MTIYRPRLLLGLVIICLIGFALSGCQKSAPVPIPSDRSLRSQDGSTEPDYGTRDSSSSNAGDFDSGALFHDDFNFSMGQLSKYTACDTLRLKSAGRKWPKSILNKIVKELNKFPALDKVRDTVYGYYLVERKSIDGSGGLACYLEGENKFALFISYEDLKEVNRSDFQGFGVSTDYVLREDLDPTLSVIIHEALHAIDLSNLINLKTMQPTKKREAAADLAWDDFDDSQYDSIGILALTDLHKRRGCHHKHLNPTNFSLANSATQDARDLKYMAEKTNFIAPYTMTNAAEDFAETVTIYYRGTRYGNWPKWTVYDEDVTNNYIEDMNVIYVADAKKILKNSSKHRKKMCAYVNLVFDEDCEDRLRQALK